MFRRRCRGRQRVQELLPGQQTKVQHSFSYSDGFGREVQKKVQAEPGPIGAHTMRRAMFFASTLGSFCVEGIGTSKIAALKGADVARRIEQFRALVDFGGKLAIEEA